MTAGGSLVPDSWAKTTPTAKRKAIVLAKLLTGGLIVCERSGRQRLYRLKNTDVAVAIEALGALAQKSKAIAVPELRFARTCYDHLAGVLSIALRNELLKRDVLRHRGD